MRQTRHGFGRRALTFGLAIFCAITLTSVGFAAWVLSNNASTDVNGGIKTETITDVSIKIEITNEGKDGLLYESVDSAGAGTNLQQIVFGPVAGVANASDVGQIQFNGSEGKDKGEKLSFVVKGNVDNIAKIGELYFNVRVPDSIINAAGLFKTTASETVTWTYEPAKAYITLPSFAMDINGNPIPDIAGASKNVSSKVNDVTHIKYVFPTDADGKVEMTVASDGSLTLKDALTQGGKGDTAVIGWTESISWDDLSALTGDSVTADKQANSSNDNFIVKPMVKESAVVKDKLEFEWTIEFGWGARYLGMNPNYFYDVAERVTGTHDTLTAEAGCPNKYTVDNMTLVNYDLLMLQATVNGLKLEDYLAAKTVGEEPDKIVYEATGIALEGSETLEAYINDTANADTIKGSLAILQANLDKAIGALKGNQVPSYQFWVFADVK